MAEAIVPQDVAMFDRVASRRLFAADIAQAGAVRRWVDAALPGHPCRDDALLVVTELFANAVLHGSRGRNETMNEPGTQRVVADWAGGERPMPRPFVLVGYQGPYVANDHGTAPLLIDAEGVQLASGAVYAWCHGGCCREHPRAWPSIEAAADFHGSYIVDASGAVHDPIRGQG